MKIAAIGGGDKEPILQPILDGLESPDILIIPSACSTETSYNKKVPACEAFFAEKGLNAHILHGFKEVPSANRVEDLVAVASLAYVIGGNTPHLLKTTALHGSDQAIKTATHEEKLWLTGTSAGALWPFAYGHSCPVAAPAKVEWEYAYLEGLSLVKAAFGAHADKIDPHPTKSDRKNRVSYMAEALPAAVTIGFAAENDAALIIDGNQARVGRATADAQLFAVESGNETYVAVGDGELTELLGKVGCQGFKAH